MPTDKEYAITKQKSRLLYAKIRLLDYNFQEVDEWENYVIGTPSFTVDSSSSLRRSANLSLVPIDKSFDVESGNKIWLDKYVKIFMGIKDIHTNEIVYTDMGIYIINNPQRTYSADNNTISLSCIDLMAKMTGLRNGNLVGLPHIIYANQNVRLAIIETIKLAGFTKYIVEECPYDVPNEINIDVGGTVYDILQQLLDIYPNYQMYFDVEGVFHYDKIPTGYNEPIMVTDDIWENVLINYSIDYDFENVKNVIEVYGKTHDIKNYGLALVENDTYKLTIASVNKLRDNLKIGFNAPSKITEPYINLNDYGKKALKNEDGSFAKLSEEENMYYVAKYLEDKDYFLFMGEITPHAEAKDENPDSPFYVNGNLGKIRIVLSGGDYDNIFMTSLAKERAEWELYTRCKVKDSISITCVPIYWLDVNWLVEITLPNKYGKEQTLQYIIKSINTTIGVNGTQTINMMRYYPEFEEKRG